MPTDATPGAPCWIDLFTSDPDRSLAFYGELFGWTAETAPPEYGGYINLSKGDRRLAGAMKNDGAAGTPDVWSVYLAVDDAAATVDRAVLAVSSGRVDSMPVGALGTMAVVTDDGGAAIGMWQPGEHRGFGVKGEPDTPTWFELHTRSYDAAVKFYENVFGWDAHTASDTAELRYTTLGEGEGQEAGIMDASAFLPDGVPDHWRVYFAVADADATVAKAVELGATVIMPVTDTPYGRLAQLTDPTGAMFCLQQET